MSRDLLHEAQERAKDAAIKNAISNLIHEDRSTPSLDYLKSGGTGFDKHGHEMHLSALPCGCAQVKCDGGCSPTSILSALDLTPAEIMCEYHRELYNRTGSRGRFDDALDVLVSIYDQIRSRRLWLRLPGGVGDGPITDLQTLERSRVGYEPEHLSAALKHLGATVLLELLDGLGDSEPVYVSGDVLDIWRSTASAFRPERIDLGEPFTPRALAVLPHKIEMAGAANCEVVPVRAFLWAESDQVPGLFVIPFCRAGDYKMRNVKPSAWISPTQWQLPIGRTVAENEAEQEKLHQEIVDQGNVVDDPGVSPVWVWRDMQAFWRLARSTVRAAERPSRASRRAAGRLNLPTNVTVIRLRRARRDTDPDAVPGTVDWSCRWIVRGHWRQLADGRQTFVHAYVKGPENRPLRATRRVWEFIR